MKNRKLGDQLECSRTKFQCTNITNQCSWVQGRHNIAHVRWSYHESRKSHYTQVSYHAYSTYTKTSNQAIREQKPIKKAQTTLKPRKLYKN